MASTKVVIGNLALQKLGVSAIARITSFTQAGSKNAAAINTCYDTLRRSELRRNFWTFSIKRQIARAVATTDKFLTFATWSGATTYALNDIVVLSGVNYISLAAANLNNAPATATTFWAIYWGPLTAPLWDNTTTYYRGELVYVTTRTWLNLVQSVPPTAPAEGTFWHEITTATPPTQSATPYRAPLSGRSFAFVKPRDFLRLAPADPRRSLAVPDYLIEGDVMISDDAGPITYRYVRDEDDTTKFDAMFDEGLASRIAMEICEEVTQSNAKVVTASTLYDAVMSEARIVNAIEGGAIEPDEDTFITVRR